MECGERDQRLGTSDKFVQDYGMKKAARAMIEKIWMSRAPVSLRRRSAEVWFSKDYIDASVIDSPGRFAFLDDIRHHRDGNKETRNHESVELKVHLVHTHEPCHKHRHWNDQQRCLHASLKR